MTPEMKLFLVELSQLLKKHGVEIEADDHWEGYAECGRDIRMTIEMEKPYGYFQLKHIDSAIIYAASTKESAK